MLNNFVRTEREQIEKTIECVDCKNDFDLTVGEVKWYKSRSYPEPKRCCICREKRKLARQQEEEIHANGDYGYND